MGVAGERCLGGRAGTEVVGEARVSQEASGSEMGLGPGPRLRARLAAQRIPEPEPVPATRNQSPFPPVKLPN